MAADRDHIASSETPLDYTENSGTIHIHGISNKVISTAFGFLRLKDIMRARICCTKFRDAAKTTLVSTRLRVDSTKKYQAMVAMTTGLPKLQYLKICNFKDVSSHKYCDGKDPNKEWTLGQAGWKSFDIQMISKFKQLKSLSISSTMLNGRYPVFFNFPLLQKLSIENCNYMKVDLEMLTGLPSLKEFYAYATCLTGNIKSLSKSKLKNTIEKVRLCRSEIKGNIMDLADFPKLKYLDISTIGENDFVMLGDLYLGKGIAGAKFHKFQRIADVSIEAEAFYRLKQRFRGLPSFNNLYWTLADDSPDRYDPSGVSGHPSPPFLIDFVRAGPRNGWRWKSDVRRNGNSNSNSCEINWLDPAPSSDYEVYTRELESIQEDIFCFEGYHQPPSHDEYKRLCQDFYDI